MFEYIQGHVDIIIWLLEIDGEAYGVEVFNIVRNDRGTIEGYIKNTTIHVIDSYTNYRMSIPTPTRHFFKVILTRIDENTIKFYAPGDE